MLYAGKLMREKGTLTSICTRGRDPKAIHHTDPVSHKLADTNPDLFLPLSMWCHILGKNSKISSIPMGVVGARPFSGSVSVW